MPNTVMRCMTTGQRHKRTHKSMQLHFEEKTPWTVRLDKSLQQHDGVNCGPIACLKVLELYGFLKEGSIKSIGESQGGYRDVVVDYYEDCCSFHASWLVPLSTQNT